MVGATPRFINSDFLIFSPPRHLLSPIVGSFNFARFSSMRSSRVKLLLGALLFVVLLFSTVNAHRHHEPAPDDLEDDESSSSSSVEPTKVKTVDLPTFTPTKLKGIFVEQFTSDWVDRWSASHATKEIEEGKEQFSYVGQWSVEEPTVLKGMNGDKGLVVKNPAAHHAISAPFEVPLDNTGKTLVVQYEVKLQNGLECGGAYLKLLTESPQGIQAQEFSDKTPYTIMFGPDKCGATNKVHFIFRHKNPISGEYEEKHLSAAPPARISKLSTLYTLIVRPDQTFEIKINDEVVKSGNLLEDFNPAVNPPEEIDDPEDKKPADWVDIARIPDPDAKKPDDWDEDAPREIPDEDAEKPEDWLDEEPLLIPDPEATKPEDWDDEEDGDWIAPTVPNPKCIEASGCGQWDRPTKMNPEYKGKWSAPMIDNPEYKGVWKPALISNPNYFKDESPSKFEKIAGIGFELWTMQNDILFDNIYIGHSESDAAKFAKETWGVKHPVEKQLEDIEKPVISDDVFDGSWKEDPVKFVKQLVTKFIDLARLDVVEAFKQMPGTGGGLVVGTVTALALLGGLISLVLGPAKPKVEPKKAKAAPKKETPTAAENDEIIVEDPPAPAEATRKRATRKAE